MRINSVELENIRSYEGGYRRNRVELPEGSVLFAGDIGSGKSSLLLAIEFALFGIRRGELSGESILRRGKRTGGVRLNFTLLGKNITIERRLKRETGSVKQDSGYLKIDGVKREGSPEELKARVLELLNYPQELLKKQKSLIYRYTVYTPQEHMKQIIASDSEDRLDTLRKVFGVDRYKTIRENSNLVTTSIRQKRRELNVAFRDLSEKKEGAKREKEELKRVEEKCRGLFRKKGRVEKELEDWRKRKEGIEERIRLYNEYDKELGREKQKKENLQKHLEELDQETEGHEKTVAEMEKLKPPTDMPVEEVKGKILGVEESVERCLKDSRGIKMEIDALLDEGVGFERSLEEKEKSKLQAEERVKTVEESLDKLIKAKDKCPVCGKDLDEKHKREKIHEYEQEIRRNDELSNRIAAEIEDLKKTIEEVEEEVEQRVSDVVREFREEKETLEKIRDELQVFNEKIREKRRLEGEIAKSKEKESRMTKELLEVEGRIEELTKQLENLRDVEAERVEIEGRIEGTVSRLRETEGELAAREADRENLKRRLEEIQREIEEMEGIKRFWSKLGAHAEWIGGYLTPLTATIERHFMLELRRQFDPVFREWFKLLIDDETLSVRLADDFSPVIDQQGYEAEYENLSGGESTSVALAYRLALNKVINTMVEEIRTRDLIILDEPTDGFSDEQLDKIRDIIEELNMPQTIIVSHEPKVESYVDNIIRIYKDDGVSRIERG